VEAEFIHGETEADGRTDMTKPIETCHDMRTRLKTAFLKTIQQLALNGDIFSPYKLENKFLNTKNIIQIIKLEPAQKLYQMAVT
jgi:hypothetical protein